MKRKEFLKTCGAGCLGLLGAASLLEGCASARYLDANLDGSWLTVPLQAFEIVKKNKKQLRNYLVVQNARLQYPIALFRSPGPAYHALLMKCTHQGTELRVFGDRLECPAHGSEFTTAGRVQNGPADKSLRVFPVTEENQVLKIDLR